MEFTYNASALAAGGVIDYGPPGSRVSTPIPSLASATLAPTGGEGKSTVSGYYSEALEFTYAETQVIGQEVAEDLYKTYTSVSMKGVRVMGKLGVDEMRATIESTRSLVDDGSDDHQFRLTAVYKNIKVSGAVVADQIAIDSTLTASSYDFVRDELGDRPDGDSLLIRFGAHTPERRTELEERFDRRLAVLGSVANTLPSGLGQCLAHKVFIPGLGTVRFAETIFKPGSRRLNLLRIVFGEDEPRQIAAEMLASLRARLVIAPVSERPAIEERIAALTALEGGLNESREDDEFGGSMTVASVEGNGSPLVP